MRATQPGPGFVGRARERETLDALLRAALAGSGHVALVAGEPGVGKTRLAEEVGRRATELGLATASGRATEDDGSPPYWPFLQVLRSLGEPPPVELDPLGDTGAAAGSPQERFRLFEDVTGLLLTAAQPRGLLVVLDDLQWGDPASLRLLVHLSMAVAPARLLVLATYRDTETAAQDELQTALTALARESTVTRLRLVGLTVDEVGAQLAGLIGWPVPDSVAAAICRRTQGNPFFVGELGRLLAQSVDGQLPDGVRDAVRGRLARLSPTCRSLVCAAGVLSSDVDPAALAGATGRDLGDVLAALDEATAAGIITATDGPRFAHDLIREAARLDVATAQQKALHTGMARYLAGRGDADARVAEVAFHWLESLPAGDAGQAVHWAERAAATAMTQLAWEEAVSLYRRVLDTGLAHGLLPPMQRCRLLLALAQAQVQAFEIDGSRQSLLAAVAIARDGGDFETIAHAALIMDGVSDFIWDPTMRSLCQEALAGIPAQDSGLRARLLALLVVSGSWQSLVDAGPRSAEALAMAERVGDRRALRETLRARQMALAAPEGATARLELGDRLLALGADGDDDAVLWGRLWRFDALAQLGDIDGAESELDPISAVVTRLRSPLAGWHLDRCQATIAAARGRFAEALGFAQQAERAARRGGSTGPLLPSVGLRTLLRAQVGGVDEEVDELRQAHDDKPATATSRGILAFWRLAMGDREEAHRLYRGLPRLDAMPPFIRLPSAAAMVDLAAEFDDRETAAEAYAMLLPYAELFICGGAGVILIGGSTRHALGVAAATLGRVEDAIAHLRAAVEINDRAGMPAAAALSRFQLAKVLARRRRPGDRDEAAGLAAAAGSTADRLGMVPLQRLVQALTNSFDPTRPGPLTAREDEIATLVAQGLTNRQIAATAHISERTVDSHVQHILEKLGFAGRTQIATWVAGGRGPTAPKIGTGSP